jgi:predicted nucleic acid-binding Zn ribbon protein
MRRRNPRPIGTALAGVVEDLAPATTLARVQRCWAGVAGDAIAREAEPVSERAGVLGVSCRSAVWAQEIELMAGDLLARLNESLARPGEPPPLRSMRVSVGGTRAAARARSDA